MVYDVNSLSNNLASFRSRVPKPSLNQPQTRAQLREVENRILRFSCPVSSRCHINDRGALRQEPTNRHLQAAAQQLQILRTHPSIIRDRGHSPRFLIPRTEGSAMPTLEEYRAWADQNLQRARAAQTESERLFYLDLARTYLREIVRLDSVTSQGLPHATALFPPHVHRR
jgi:hypothetical protein